MSNTISVDTSEIIVTPIDEYVSINICESIAEVVTGDTGPQGPRGTQVLSGNTDPSPIIGLIGDQYLNVATGFIFGPKTESGWGSGSLLGSGLLISDVSYVHYQTPASAVWTITHPLSFAPSITVVDLDSKVIEGDYEYSGNTIVARFSNDVAGAAYLS